MKWSGSRWGQELGCCECGNEFLGPVIEGISWLCFRRKAALHGVNNESSQINSASSQSRFTAESGRQECICCVCVCVCVCIHVYVNVLCLCVCVYSAGTTPIISHVNDTVRRWIYWPLDGLCLRHMLQLHPLPQSNNWSVFSLLLPNAEVIFRAMWRQWNKYRRPVWTQLAVSRTITINNVDPVGSSSETYGNRLTGDRITKLSNCSLTFIFRQLLSHTLYFASRFITTHTLQTGGQYEGKICRLCVLSLCVHCKRCEKWKHILLPKPFNRLWIYF